ncbi:MAG TPA: TMEM175 family protein [Candidatus Dormibacteraeota bacterium]|nr:TMEM175 family protein [Candidatus Dormibacteraeota bacterium]
MSKGRLEAFSDAVIAIIITIMVLELRPPDGATLEDLTPLAPTFGSYVLSFALLGTYWNNHHHLLQTAKTVDGMVLWANLHLLFWLSLFPFGTAWVGESEFAPVPVAAYGLLLLLAAIAYYGVVRALVRAPGQAPSLEAAVGRDIKGKVSPMFFLVAIPIALFAPGIAMAIYIGVVVMWVIPDRRMERAIRS